MPYTLPNAYPELFFCRVCSKLFADADDIADVVLAALSEEGHNGRIYEFTGHRPVGV